MLDRFNGIYEVRYETDIREEGKYNDLETMKLIDFGAVL